MLAITNSLPVSLAEFDLIDRFFRRQKANNPSTLIGIGDDCALIKVGEEAELAVTTDTLVEGIHFFKDADPESLGHKSLAVNLSDLAAMGANPCWATLALALPAVDEVWLRKFSQGFFDLADYYSLDLVGGDTTQGPLTITVQAIGLVPSGQAMLRSTANVGDSIYVTGWIGDAGLGLKIMKSEFNGSDLAVLNRLHRPLPRIEAGLQLTGVANACIDISDGLAADLGHILKASGVGATVFWDQIPFSTSLEQYVEATGDWDMPLIAGDDYELCFTVPIDRTKDLERCMTDLDYPYTRIGVIEEPTGLRLVKDSEPIEFPQQGFEHFGETGSK